MLKKKRIHTEKERNNILYVQMWGLQYQSVAYCVVSCIRNGILDTTAEAFKKNEIFIQKKNAFDLEFEVKIPRHFCHSQISLSLPSSFPTTTFLF